MHMIFLSTLKFSSLLKLLRYSNLNAFQFNFRKRMSKLHLFVYYYLSGLCQVCKNDFIA